MSVYHAAVLLFVIYVFHKRAFQGKNCDLCRIYDKPPMLKHGIVIKM